VVLILAGWGLAQFPYLVRPAITFESAATAPSTMRLLLVSLAAGAVFLFPAIYLLMRIFKKEVLYGRPGRKP
jgi:cytochrome d ubiquinol oxidase subunit II